MANSTLTNPKELKSAFDELAKRTNEKYGVKLTGDDVLKILEHQFEVIPDAIKAGESVKLAYIGKFSLGK